ncbi:zinc finger protein 729 [Apis mellifera]|uniref:Zinc finger protein 729 n=1 Tax=Apis mellifera TaxID=7460 RepID=A0A7M7MSK7_APIME|nr:zinc finger protein 729 [Apis mellifera]|eukprot:XP_026300388.1 zinc finger protein 729 [Apis mellifera]
MESYEEDDDTHFCIKCHLTIHGLENYVRHRQSGCRPPDDKNVSVWVSPATPASPTTVSYPEILNADAFFSSLELQSSSKTNPRKAAPSLLVDEGKKSTKKEERRKKGGQRGGGVVAQVDHQGEEGKEKHIHNMLPQVPVLVDDPTDYLCIPSLVGFPDIVPPKPPPSAHNGPRNKLAQSMGHATGSMVVEGGTGGAGVGLAVASSSSSSPSTASSKTHHHEAENSLVGGQGLGERKRQEEQQQSRMEQVHQTWLEDTILAELVANNEASSGKDLARYGFGYQQEEDEEDDMLEEDLGEEEEDGSYAESEEDRERSLRGHTGGKWKPELDDLPQNMSQLQEDDEDEQHQEHPPPSHTGGKWRPSDASHKEEYGGAKGSNVVGQQPAGHTRGKWIPSDVVESGYWCNPCGRKLASRLVYNRHLRSDLHARRSVREMDGVLCPQRAANAVHAAKKPRHQLDRQRVEGRGQAAEAKLGGVKKSLRRREREILCCEMCNARVRRAQMGKHLLSHYHCRVAGVNPRGPRARRFLLENMANVVRQCPFQCFSCRFYCNTEDTFLRHWRSELHAKTLEQISGSYRCTPCDFWCEGNEAMESHLLDPGHRDVCSMMNGSVPIMIGRQRGLACAGCDRRFRYNLQLRIHARETGHEEGLTASDEYQQRLRCKLCPRIVRSLVALQRHQLSCHAARAAKGGGEGDTEPYFCSFCSMNFATAREAVLHRRTSSHKEVVKARKCNEAAIVGRQCPHCEEKQANLSDHKRHLLDRHPELCYRCPKCGTLFALSQDVTRHTRENKCQEDDEGSRSKAKGSEEWRCGECSFSTESRSEFIFHEALHAGPVSPGCQAEKGAKPLAKYSCPVCKRAFAKVSLRNHIRSHTGERPFPCAKCLAPFSRRSDLNAHQKECAGSSSSGWPGAARKRGFACSECNNAFYTKHSLRQHMLRHAGKKYKCGLPGCPTVLRTASELRSHVSLVHEATTSTRRYKCSDCSYAAKTRTQLRRHRARHDGPENATKSDLLRPCPYSGCAFRTKIASHLQRHVRLHTGTKPYKCRHCPYASNNLENLRKHVLSTNLHPGKTIYECDVCQGDDPEPFRTNFAKELRAHLMEVHSDTFSTPGHANDYVIGIFKVHRSTDFVDEPN